MKSVRNNKMKMHRSEGFSLIEVLVSFSIFTVVVTISVGALLALVESNTRAQNMQSVMTNITFALDSMTREIRTGEYYYCGDQSDLPTDEASRAVSDCPSGYNSATDGFAFREGGRSLTEDASSRWIAFRLNNNALERRLGDDPWVTITTPSVTLNELQFTVTGSDPTDNETPTATVYIAGTTGTGGAATFFDIQTTMAQFLLDIP